MNDIIDLVVGTFSDAVGFMSNSIGELYWFMVSWVIIAFIFSMIARPTTLSAVAMVIPIPTILLMFVVAFFIEYWVPLVNSFAELMVYMGASSSPVTSHIDFRNPDAILAVGWEVSLPARLIMNAESWYSNFFVKLMALGSVLLIMAAYALAAIIIVFSFTAYYLISLIAAVFLPLAIFNRTSFLAEGALKYVAGTGIVLMAIALVCGVMGNVVGNLEWDQNAIGLGMFLNNAVIGLMLIVVVVTPKVAARVAGTGSVFGVGDAIRGMAIAGSVAKMAGMLGGTMGIGGGGGASPSVATAGGMNGSTPSSLPSGGNSASGRTQGKRGKF